MILVVNEPFDPWQWLTRYQSQTPHGAAGAVASFVGWMRDSNHGETVSGMFLEHYPGMTERVLEELVAEAAHQWPMLDSVIVHRVGDINPGEAIVLVATWAAHRGAALASCDFLIEQLKSRAPFWKKERVGDGDRWVEHNTVR